MRLLFIVLAITWLAIPVLAERDPMTPKQLRALRQIRDRYEDQRQDLQLRLQSRRLELARLIREDQVEKESVQNKLDEILELERKRQQLFVDEIFEAKEQLTPSQWGPFRQRVLRHLLEERRAGGQLPRLERARTSP